MSNNEYHNPDKSEPTREIIPVGPSAPIRRESFAIGNNGLDFLSESEPPGTAKPLSLSMFWRFKWIILAGFLLVTVPSLVVIWKFTLPVYRASAQIRVRPIIPRLVFKTDENGQIPLFESYLNTQVAVMMSPTVLQRVLDQADVLATRWYKNPDPSFLERNLTPIERLIKNLSATPRGRTEIIDLSMNTVNALDATTIVNTVLEQYIKFIRERSDQTGDILYRKLTEEYNTLQNEIEGREKVAAKLRKELGTGTPDELVSRRRVRIDEMEARLEEVNRQIAIAEMQQKEIDALLPKKTDKFGKATTQPAASPLQYESDSEWRRLYVETKTMQTQVVLQKDTLGEFHPKMIELKKHLQLSQEALGARESQLALQWKTQGNHLLNVPGSTDGGNTFMKDLNLLQGRVKLLKFEEKMLVGDLKRQSTNFDKTFDSAQLLSKEEDAIHRTRELYNAVRTQLDQKEMERDVPGSIDILARAFPPSEPNQDRRLLLSILAIFGGLSTGMGLSYLRAVTSQTIHEAEDFSLTRTPFLGQLPLVREPHVSTLEDSPIQNECIRMIRTALLERLDRHRSNTILITSAGPKVGKTTVAIMLARSLAHSGKKVLLVDADLRNPSVSARFKMDSEIGLINLLTSKMDDEQTINKSKTSRLSILPAGRMTQDTDPELLANGAFTACLERWRNKYDLVILDSPPVLPVADARILSRHADGTVMIIREGLCRRNEVTESLAFLGTSGAKLLGTVFIGSHQNRSYRYGYNNYYPNTHITIDTKS